MNIINKSDFIASIVLFFMGVLFYFIIIPREIILEDKAVLGPDLLPNICIIAITILSIILFLKSVRKKDKLDQIDQAVKKTNFSSIEVKRVFFLSLNLLVSILIFVYLDVLTSAIFLIIGSCIVCGLKKMWVIASLSSGLILLVYFLLYKVLGTAVG